MPQGGSTGPYGGNAYATPYPGSPYGPPQQYAPQPQYGAPGGELYAPGQQGGQMPQPQNGPPSGGSPYEPMPDDTAGDDLADQTSVAPR